MNSLLLSLFRPVWLALTSALLLVATFPSWSQPWCAWVALVPWLALLGRSSARQAFWWSYAIGLMFFLASMWWLTFVTWLGWVMLCAYLALYFGVFGWSAHRIRRAGWGTATLLALPAMWVILEFLRSHLLSGLGWNLLAYSQTPWLVLVQVAEVTGAWGVSFLIVFVNTALADVVIPCLRTPGAGRRLLGAITCLALAVGYGVWRMPRIAVGPPVRLALVQGNIPQEQKWDPAYAGIILQRYDTLTRDAADTAPSLIVWPETSIPDVLQERGLMAEWVGSLARSVRRPLLIGGPMSRLVGGQRRLTNSAALVGADGAIRQRYDKLRLVPFGEYIPFERFTPWLRNALPPIGDFIPGNDSTVFSIPMGSGEWGMGNGDSEFRIPDSDLKFSVLICFEDIFPGLARRFVRRGAHLLLNITNDAWFGPTGAAYQHAQASTFRAVEFRVPVARAANTGWSGCIDPAGRWRGRVADAEGRELFVPGTITCELPTGRSRTLYLRWGEWFIGLCLLGIAGGFLQSARVAHRRSKPSQ